MSYKKHMAWKRRGEFFTSYLCVCTRTVDHEEPRRESAPDVPLFDLLADGEIAR